MEPYVEPSSVEPSRLGYSRGHWEGETLVVETSQIDYPFFDLPPWWGIPQTQALELVERFTLEDDTLEDGPVSDGPVSGRSAGWAIAGREVGPALP